MRQPVFPRWANKTRTIGVVLLGVAPIYLVGVVWYTFSPKTTDVGYQPKQPVPYSHALHAGELGIDCRYCHSTVDKSAFAALPATATCMNCHARVRNESPNIAKLKESMASGEAIRWKKVNDLPDYVYFDHSAHVNNGVGCVSCHGRVDTMVEVRQTETLSMGFCLDCHRNPGPNLRPLSEVTNMAWQPPDAPGEAAALGQRLAAEYGLKTAQVNGTQAPATDCSTCHR